MPALEVLKTETFHIEFPHPLGGNGLKPVGLVDRKIASCGETGLAQSGKVCTCFRITAFAAICFGTYEVLLCQTENLRHIAVVDLQVYEPRIAVILHQKRTAQLVAVTCLESAEIGSVALVTALIEVQGRLRRHKVRVIVIVVAGEVQEDRTLRGTIGSGGVAELENDFK